MPDGFQVDPNTLEQVAGSLVKASDNLGTAPAEPQSVDAGDLSEVFTRLVAKLVKDADQISVGLAAAGEEVATTRTDYLTHEHGARNRFGN